MDFGRVSLDQLEKIQPELAAEPDRNRLVLPGIRASIQKCYLGCSSWGQPGWTGRLFPTGTKENNYLAEYVRHFNCVELNATHYRVWEEAAIRKWAEKAAGRDFVFCPKMFPGITHRGSLTGKSILVEEFLQGIRGFGNHLGPVLIQLSDQLTIARKQECLDFLSALPADIRFFLELRHAGWFEKNNLLPLLDQLQEKKIGLVITDTIGRPDVAPMYLSIPDIFIRFVGYNGHRTDLIRVENWINRLADWYEAGLEKAYFMLHLGEGGQEPDLAIKFAEKLEKKTGIRIPVPVLSSLF